MNDARKEIRSAASVAGAMLLFTLLASFAFREQAIDRETLIRLVLGANGLIIVYYGNRAPKKVAPTVFAGKVARFSGWSQVLTGLAYVALWAFASMDVAIILGTAIVAAGALASLGYCFWLRSRHAGRRLDQPRA